MTEEKPLSGQNDSTGASEPAQEPTAPSAPANETDGIMAALSALSSAAAPVRDESAAAAVAPAPEKAKVVFTPAPSPAAPAATAQTPPPPPSAPESADSYPAPVGAPIALSAPTAAVIPPAPATKKKKWPWILAICIVAGVLLLGGMFACVSTTMNAAFHAIQHNERHYDYDDYFFNPDADDGLLNYYYSGMHATFDELLDYFNINEGEIAANGMYEHGAYRVGDENGIAPGLYYLQGSQNGVSNFYVFHAANHLEDPDYTISSSVEYFGNYYAELEEEDVIIFAPFDTNSTMALASDKPMDVIPPYKSGCYRVGIDIPAGTYTITCDVDAARETDSEAGAYVMQDLEFGEDSITESVYVIKGGRQTITVENGEYLELFAAIATPATASTKVPLQHIENEVLHVA